MEIDLAGATIAVHGETTAIVDAVLAALRANDGTFPADDPGRTPDILLVSCPLDPEDPVADADAIYAAAGKAAAAMTERGGRIVFLISAVATMPMRRHPRFSMASASILAAIRALAMEFGPKVLINAVGVGAIEDGEIVAGDQSMLSHTPVGRAGTVDEAIAAVLFFCDPSNSYTTGQMLGVDGGWAAGYGRNF